MGGEEPELRMCYGKFMLPLRNTPQFTVSSILGLPLRNAISQVYAEIQNVFVLDRWDLDLCDSLQKQSCPKTDLKKFLAHFCGVLGVHNSRGERQLLSAKLSVLSLKIKSNHIINIGLMNFENFNCFLLFFAFIAILLPPKMGQKTQFCYTLTPRTQ